MLRALLFDMDGVLIDSEPLWHRSEISAFAEADLALTAEDCLRTTGLRVDETVAYWCERFPALAPSPNTLVADILARLIRLVREEGEAKPGVDEALAFAHRAGLRLALASSSPYAVIEAVTARLGIASAFEVIHSAEEEERGKPDPAVYLTTARKLGVDPADCVAIEDSPNGLLSAKAAGMRCLAIPEPALRGDPRFALADAILSSLVEIGEEVWNRLDRAK